MCSGARSQCDAKKVSTETGASSHGRTSASAMDSRGEVAEEGDDDADDEDADALLFFDCCAAAAGAALPAVCRFISGSRECGCVV